MITYSALTTLMGKAQAEALGAALERMEPEPTGVGVFEIEDDSGLWEVGAYFLEAPDAVGLQVLEAAFGAKPFVVSEIPETDWVAKVRRELAPVRVGRFIVHGSHDEIVPEGNEVPLLIEAAMAFGTGHHGTTAGCLAACEALIAEGFVPRSVADIGCGSAVLAMAATAVWDCDAIASDNDPVAVEVAQHNCSVNGQAERVTCLEATGFDHAVIKAAAPFDLIFANILMGPLIALAPDLAAHLAPGGRVILSGLLNEQAATVAEKYEDEGLTVSEINQMGEWSTVCLRKDR
ncbi:50S ribosomal protein L11 methyltransferase [Alphaproteobacteria bacterium KMM 3653]|uniref:Ribosomal protein L11 methyltransferase n=1 Tax=Harenicola maris TaxID=2841044 RepID=A0AAP2CW10_9RHOB|nr:50S ribosomal protein L11 methyltransferase [Harenicola maris]